MFIFVAIITMYTVLAIKINVRWSWLLTLLFIAKCKICYIHRN